MSSVLVVASRVWQTTATTGTGDISFDASVPTGYRSFVSAIGNGNFCPYVIDDGQGNWEIGLGTISSGTPDSMARTTVKSNSLGTTAKINFESRTKTVKVCPTGSSYVYLNSAASAGQVLVANASGGFDPTTTGVLSLPGRNVLINAGFAIDQRNAGASTAISDDTYCFDRWYALTQTAAVNTSQLTEPEDGYPFAIRLTQNQATAQRMGLAQIVEGVNCKHLRGGSGTLVPRVRCSSAQPVRYAILGWTGTEDAVTSDVVNSWTNATFTAGQFFNSTTLSVLAVGAQTPSANTWTSLAALTATMGSTFKNVIVFIWTEGTAAQNVTLDIDFVQLESGAIATAFERREYATEFARCQRYFQNKIGDVGGNWLLGNALSTAIAQATYYFNKMRAAPTVTLPSAGKVAGTMAFLTAAGAYPATVGSHTTNGINPDYFTVLSSGYSSLTAQAPSYLVIPGATVTMSAEL